MVTLADFTVRSAYKNYYDRFWRIVHCVEVARALIQTPLKPSLGGDRVTGGSGAAASKLSLLFLARTTPFNFVGCSWSCSLLYMKVTLQFVARIVWFWSMHEM